MPRDARSRQPKPIHAACAVAALVAGLAGCSRIEAVLDDVGVRVASTPREAYENALVGAGLEGTPLVDRWRGAAEDAISEPVAIDPPFREIAFFPAEEPSAAAYLVSLERGQALLAALDLEPADTTGVFLEVFERSETGGLRLVASAREGARDLEFEPPQGGTFVLRVQPELLRSVRVTLTVLRAATLAFPVQDRDTDAILSYFGDDREAGRRTHHGVDIFAPRGTPVLATADGEVYRVQNTNLGGLVVWLRDESNRRFYYAHLDRQLVERGQRVRVGDTLGLVGNTGNARTTPPHLHFGIYIRRRGPVNPYPFLHQPSTRAPTIRADTSRIGTWVRLRAEAEVSEAAPSPARLEGSDTDAEGRLPRHTVVRVIAASGRTLRVRLPDGRMALVQDASVESIDTPIDEWAVREGEVVLARPTPDALPKTRLDTAGSVPVVGRFRDYRLVRSNTGEQGWVAPRP